MSLKTYFDFADSDYQFFMDSYERGSVANAMGVIAQNICERYMKHLIERFDKVATPEEKEKKKEVLSTHKLHHLFNYIHNNLDVDFSHDAKRKMRVINGFYFSARYPADVDFDELTRDDIEDCVAAVKICRKETLELIEKLEKKPSLTETLEAAEQRAGTCPSDTSGKEPAR